MNPQRPIPGLRGCGKGLPLCPQSAVGGFNSQPAASTSSPQPLCQEKACQPDQGHGERGRILELLQTEMARSSDRHPQKSGQKFASKRSFGSGSKKAQNVHTMNGSQQEPNVFPLARGFPSCGSERKIARIEPAPRDNPLSLSSDDYFIQSVARGARYEAIYVNEKQTKREPSNSILFDFLYWLLIDYENPDQFATKLAITQESFANRLKHEKPEMVVEFVENIAIAIRRIEKSKHFQSKWRKVFTAECVENFMTFHVVQLFLNNQFSSETIDLLKACNVIQQNSMFQTFLRVVVHAEDASDAGADLSQMKPSSAVIPRTADAWKRHFKKRERYEQIYVREEQNPTEADSLVMKHHFLLWLLEDFEEPDMFVWKLAITPDALPRRLKSAHDLPIDFVGNIAIAIWRIENSKNYMAEWHDKLHEQMEPLVTIHIVRLLLKNQLSLETMQKLKGCRLIRENQHFRRLIGLPPLVADERMKQ